MKKLYKILLSALTAATMLINIMPVVSMAEEDVIIDGNKVTRVFWNLDFDDGATYTAGSGDSTYNIKKNGSDLVSDSGNTKIRCDYGDFTFETKTDAVNKSNENSLKIVNNNSGQTRLWEFQAHPDSNVIVWSYDYLVADYGVNRVVGNMNYYPSSGNSGRSSFGQLGLSMGGQLKLGTGSGGTTVGKKLETNTWYNIKYVIDATEAPSASYTVYLDNDTVLTSGTLNDFYGVERVNIYDESKQQGEPTTWIDNIKVYEYAKPLAISSVSSSDDKSLDLVFTEKVSAFDGDNVEGIEISYGSNKLTPVSCEYIAEKTLRVTTLEDVFTSVDMTVSVYDSINDREASYIYKKSAKSVDVGNVTFTPGSGEVSVSADIVVETGSSLDVCVLLVLKNAEGATVGIVRSACLTLTSDDTITLSGYHSEAVKAEIIFIDNLTDCRPIKNLKYESVLN